MNPGGSFFSSMKSTRDAIYNKEKRRGFESVIGGLKFVRSVSYLVN